MIRFGNHHLTRISQENILDSMKLIHYSYSSGSGCPFPRNANSTIASEIKTPIAAPYATIPASAMIQLTQSEQ